MGAHLLDGWTWGGGKGVLSRTLEHPMVTDICAYTAALSNVWQWFFPAIRLWKILTIVGRMCGCRKIV